MRRTCEGILVCHDHNHPHVLMLQIANAFFKLPGDYLPHDADEIPAFKTRLNERLALSGNQFSNDGNEGEWEIGETLAQWWRPNFETFMYPFIPPHVSRPKECKKLYFIQLPSSSMCCTTLETSPTLTINHRSPECSQEHETTRRSTIRALRQRSALWSSTFRHPSSTVPLQFRIRRRARKSLSRDPRRQPQRGQCTKDKGSRRRR